MPLMQITEVKAKAKPRWVTQDPDISSQQSTLLDVIDSLDTIQSMENGSSHPTGPSTLHPHLKKGKVKQTENTVQEGLEDEPDDRNVGLSVSSC